MTATTSKPHTESSYDQDLNHLDKLLNDMGARDLAMLSDSLEAFSRHDVALARRQMAADAAVNSLAVETDERCLALLARWQPLASDLRSVATALKIVIDLERIGDLCVNIAQTVSAPAPSETSPPPVEIVRQARLTQDMVGDAISALRGRNVRLALRVLERVHHADALHDEQITQACLAGAALDLPGVLGITRIIALAGYLHRIAAHATNIAEMVVFRVHG